MKHTARMALAATLAGSLSPSLPAATPPGIQWETIRIEDSQTDLLDVASNGAGRLVTVGNNGVIGFSDDHAAHWDSIDDHPNCDLTAVTWNGIRWVVAGGRPFEASVIMTSADCTAWTTCCLGGMPMLRTVAASPGTVVALGVYEAVARSTDLVSWTTEAPGTRDFNDVVWTGTRFVGVGSAGRVKTSPDGVAWTAQESNTTEDLTAVAWNGSALVAVGIDNTAMTPLVMRSTTGTSWDPVPLPGFPSVQARALAWTGSCFVATGGLGYMFTSPDGLAWTYHQVPSASGILAFTWDGSHLVGVGLGGLIVTTTDPTPETTADWTIQSHRDDLPTLRALAIGSVGAVRRTVVVGESGTVLSSDDEGATGGDQASGVSNNLLDVAATGLPSPLPRFIAVGSNGTIITSPDAVTWAHPASGTTNYLSGVTWFAPLSPIDPSLAIAVGDNGTILTSENGSTWTPRASGATAHLRDVANGSVLEGKPPVMTKRIVAVGLDGTILSSPGGGTWTPRTSGTTRALLAVANGNNLFVAVGASGTVLTSPDGIAWTVRSTGGSQYLQDIAWTGTQWVATASGGAIYTSPTASTWTRRHSSTARDLYAVLTLDSGRLMAAGDDGLVLTSDPAPDFADWIAVQSPPAGQDDPDDDPNHDGIDNLAAYALGIPAVAPTTSADRQALPLLVQPQPGHRMLLRLSTNHQSVGDLVYVIEQSTTLAPGSWTELLRHYPGQTCSSGSLNVTESQTSEFIIIEFPEAIGSRPACFARLRLDLLDPP